MSNNSDVCGLWAALACAFNVSELCLLLCSSAASLPLHPSAYVPINHSVPSLCLMSSLSLSTTGYLCGSCVSGTGVTGLLNRCEACDTANATLIVALGKLSVAPIYHIVPELYTLSTDWSGMQKDIIHTVCREMVITFFPTSPAVLPQSLLIQPSSWPFSSTH